MYLLTYSRADLEKVPTRDVFAEMVSLACIEMAGVKVIQWVVARELHADAGASESHSHYHMALKLEKRARWLKVRKFLDDSYGIKVNFSSNHNTYYSTYKYTTKEDRDCVHSEGYPDLENTPQQRTENAISGNKRKAARSARVSKKRKCGMSMYEVAQFIQAKNVKSRLQLMSIAASQNRESKTDLAQFICNRGGKAVDECLAVAHELATAEAKFARSKKTRIELLHDNYTGECVAECNGEWMGAAVHLLTRNEISVSVFAQAVFTLLDKRDIELSKDTPIVATSDAPIVFIKGGSVCHANTEMMNVRWRFFHFWRQIPPSEQLQLTPCGHCFSKLILDNINGDTSST